MKKVDLQRRVDFLLLQLKTINDIITKDAKNDSELYQKIGTVEYYSSPTTIKNRLTFIENYNEQYNFYNKLMGIDDYKLD